MAATQGFDHVVDHLIREHRINRPERGIPELVAVGQQHVDQGTLDERASDHPASVETVGRRDAQRWSAVHVGQLPQPCLQLLRGGQVRPVLPYCLTRLRLRPTRCIAMRLGAGVDTRRAPAVGQRDAIESPPFMSPSSG